MFKAVTTVCLISLCVQLCKCSLEIIQDMTKDDVYRLHSPDIHPLNYKISIRPYHVERHSKEYLTFKAVVKIKLEIVRPTQIITLHSQGLLYNRENCNIRSLHNDDPYDFTIRFEPDKHLVHFSKADGQFSEGKYSLVVSYAGKIVNQSKTGIFYSSYVNEKGENDVYVLTNFKPTYARLVLPCFDEPSYKATFDVTIIHKNDFVAISNMPVKSITTQGLTQMTTFKTTPKMSIHLLAFAVSDFKSIGNEAGNFKVHTTPELFPFASATLNFSQRIYKETEKFTGVKDEIGKLDQIFLPFYSSSVMGNWGLSLYGSNLLLGLNKSIPSFSSVKNIARGITQQWFENLATPKWWNHMWLSESISSYMVYYILEKVDPKLQSMNNFMVHSLIDSLSGEYSFSMHKNVQNVKDPFEIRLMLHSALTQRKGACIVRMMQHMLTEPVFQKGIQNFISKKSHANVDLNDFYQAIQEVLDSIKINLDIKTVMDSWLNFEDYPLVNVKRNYENHKIELQQECSFNDGASYKSRHVKRTWHIPINYASKGKLDFTNTSTEYWLTDTSMIIDSDVDSKDWIILNKQYTGFYRVNYDDNNWKLVIDYLKSHNRENIHVYNRIQLLNDAFALVRNDILDLKILMQLYDHLKNEKSCLVWYVGLNLIDWLNEKLLNIGKDYLIFQTYVSKTIQLIVEDIGFKDKITDNDFTRSCRRRVLSMACKMDDLNSKKIVLNRFKNLLQNPKNNSISSLLKRTLLCYGFQQITELDEVYKLYSEMKNIYGSNEKIPLWIVIGCSSSEIFLRKHLKMLSKKLLFDEIYNTILTMLNHNKVGVDIILDFLINDVPLSEFKKRPVLLQLTIYSLASQTPKHHRKLLQSEKFEDYQKSINRSIQESEKNDQWLQKYGKKIIETIKGL